MFFFKPKKEKKIYSNNFTGCDAPGAKGIKLDLNGCVGKALWPSKD